MADAWGRGYRSGQGLRRGILLGLRESAKSIAAGPELAVGSDKTVDPAAITPTPAAQVVITLPPQQPKPISSPPGWCIQLVGKT